MRADLKMVSQPRESKPADPIDRFTTREFDSLLASMAGHPVRRRSRGWVILLDLAPAFDYVSQHLAALPDTEAVA